MIAGTITLALVVAPFVFSVAQDTGDSTPEVSFAFTYSENADESTRDTLDNTAGDVAADGLLTIQVESGSALDAAQLSIDGNASSGALTAGAYSGGDQLLIGDEIRVWITRGDAVDIVWESEAGDESQILDRFTMAEVTDLPPGIPNPDYDCSGWTYPDDFDAVDGIVADDNDLILDGVILECDLTEYSIPNVKIRSNGGLVGNADVDGSFNVLNGSSVWGEFVRASGDIELDGGGEIDADVDASGGVDLDGGTVITGSVDTEGDLDIQTDSEIAGDVSLSSNNIDADSAVLGGDVTLTNDATLNNLDDTYVGGDIRGEDGDSVVLNNGSTVVGDVSVESGGDLQCSDGDGSTIAGVGCPEYKQPEFEVTIDGTNAPVEEGSALRVNAVIANTGIESDTGTIALDIDGTEKNSTSVTLGGGETTTETLEWTTSSGDAGTYTANVSSEDDFRTEGVEVAADLPPEFATLNLTLTKFSGDELSETEFGYSIDWGNSSTSTTFELEVSGSVEDSTVRNGTSGTWKWDHNKKLLPVTLRADISGGECYEIQIPDSASKGDSYDVLVSGSTC